MFWIVGNMNDREHTEETFEDIYCTLKDYYGLKGLKKSSGIILSTEVTSAKNIKTVKSALPGIWRCRTHERDIKTPTLRLHASDNPVDAFNWDLQQRESCSDGICGRCGYGMGLLEVHSVNSLSPAAVLRTYAGAGTAR